MDLLLRLPTAEDSPGIVALVDGVYREYGDRVCLEDADRDLLSFHDFYAADGGEAIVLAHGSAIVGLHAVVPLGDRPGVCTFRRLYLTASLRGGEWGERLMRWAMETAKQKGFSRVEFWSDVRFLRAHRFFARLGFQPDGRRRVMTDSFEPYSEYFFFREL